MDQPERTRRKRHISGWGQPPRYVRVCPVCGASKGSVRHRKLGLHRWLLDGEPMTYCPGKQEDQKMWRPGGSQPPPTVPAEAPAWAVGMARPGDSAATTGPWAYPPSQGSVGASTRVQIRTEQ